MNATGTEATSTDGTGTKVDNLRRLLAPRHIAVIGGREAAEVVRQCRRIGFPGVLWPVHPYRDTIEGLPCFRDVDALPEAPDAGFVAVPRETTVDVVAALARRGAGGAVCYASGFSEVGPEGRALQRRLVEAAGEMAIIGPNCYGVLNYLDGAALWPDQHGGTRTGRGAAIITQSGNIGLNLTMQRRSLPLAYLIAVGNMAGAGVAGIMDALLDDPRVTAIGLHLEGIDDVAAFSRAAVKAHGRRIPLVALKSGGSELGAKATVSHTSTLAGPDVLYDALFARLGIARVHDLDTLLETLKFCSVHGALGRSRIASASCSGGEATLVADLAQPRHVALPAFPGDVERRLRDVLGARVAVGNPLDYHTYIWGDPHAQTACFTALLSAGFDMHLLVLDLPRDDRCTATDWKTTLDAFVQARRATAAPASVVSSLPEGLPEQVGAQLLAEGIAPMQGIGPCLDAIRAAATIGAAHARQLAPLPRPAGAPRRAGLPARTLDEWAGKRVLSGFGVPTPDGRLVTAEQAAACGDELGYPVVLKAVSDALTHKTEAGAVALDLWSAAEVDGAARRMAALAPRFLVERMARNVVCELIVGVHRDDRFGLALTLGAGGVLVELMRDTVTLLLPASRDEIRAALASLRIWPLVTGYRGRPRGDAEAVADAVTAVARCAGSLADRLRELDVNPLLVLPEGQGVLAVDVLMRLSAVEGDDAG
jgi:acyl-CoA synthetase (NDP forming)